MEKRALLVLCLAACLIFIACPSRRSAPGPDEASALRGRIDLLSGYLEQRGVAARILGDLSRALPENAWLTEAGYDGAAVRVKGFAPSNTVVADYVARLGGSTVLADVNLQTSVERRVGNRARQEFAVQATVRGTGGLRASAAVGGEGSGGQEITALAARVAELEKDLPTGKNSAGVLRKFQVAADESGMKIAKFAQGAEIPGEFYNEWPVSLEVTGSRRSLGIFLEKVGEMPGLWLVKQFSFRTASPQDADSPVRASLTAKTCFLK